MYSTYHLVKQPLSTRTYPIPLNLKASDCVNQTGLTDEPPADLQGTKFYTPIAPQNLERSELNVPMYLST